nr:unnamed protein product [Callosobruchus analis]
MSTKNKPPDIGDKKCEICDDFIRKGSARVKCNGQDCSVALHQKCFLAIAKIIKIDRDEWQCKGCIDESSSQAGGEAICQELAMMKEEVRLLKEMLAEVRLSNKLLIERLEKLPQVDNHTLNEKNSSLSYSEILSNIPRKQSTSVLIIKSKNGKDDNIDVMNTIKSNINPSSENIMIERTKLVKNGMLVTCCDGKSLEKLKTIVDKQFSNKFDSFVPKRFKPRLLVSDVDKSVESKEEFLNMLVQNNQYLSDKDIKVVSMIKLKFSLNVILEVEPEVRKHILSTVYCGGLYKPPNVSHGSLEIIGDALSIVYLMSSETIVMGDLNINLLNENAVDVKSFKRLADSFNLTQIVQEATRISDSSHTLLDIILVSNANAVSRTGTVLLPAVSDHLLTFCCLELPSICHSPKTVTYRDLKNMDLNLMNDICSNVNWSYIEQLNDIDTKVLWLNNVINYVLDICAPYKTRLFNKRKSPPWITSNIKFMMKLRNRSFSAYKCLMKKNNVDPALLTSKWIYYKQLRNLVTFSIRMEKKAYIESKMKNIRDSKGWWRTVNDLGIHKKSQISLPPELNDPNEFNNVFISSIPSCKPSLDYIAKYRESRSSQARTELNLSTITDKDILNAISLIKSNAAGGDGFSLDIIELFYLTAFVP